MGITFSVGSLIEVFYEICGIAKQIKGTVTNFDDDFVQIKLEDTSEFKNIKISTILEITEISNKSKNKSKDTNCNNIENTETKILEKIKQAFEYSKDNYDFIEKLFFSYLSTNPPFYPTKYWDKNNIKINFNIEKILKNINTTIVDRNIIQSSDVMQINNQITYSIIHSTNLFDCINKIIQTIQQAIKSENFNSENEFIQETYNDLYKINTILDLEILQELLGLLAINLNTYITTNGYNHLKNSYLINLANTITSINKQEPSIAMVNILNLLEYNSIDSKLKQCNIIELISFIRFTSSKKDLFEYFSILTNHNLLESINSFVKRLSFTLKQKPTEDFIPFDLISKLNNLNSDLTKKLKEENSYYPDKKLLFKNNKIIKNEYIDTIISKYTLDTNLFDYNFASNVLDKSILNNKLDINYLWKIFNIAKNKNADELFDILVMILDEYSISFEEIFGYPRDNTYQLFNNHFERIKFLYKIKSNIQKKINKSSANYTITLFNFYSKNKDFIENLFNQIENLSQKIQTYCLKYLSAYNDENTKEEYLDKFCNFKRKNNNDNNIYVYLFSKLDSDTKVEFSNILKEYDGYSRQFLDKSKISHEEISTLYQRYLFRNNQLCSIYKPTNITELVTSLFKDFYHNKINLHNIQQFIYEGDANYIHICINLFCIYIINYTNINPVLYNVKYLSTISENKYLYNFVINEILNIINYSEQFSDDKKINLYTYIETLNFLEMFCNVGYCVNQNSQFYKKSIEYLHNYLEQFPQQNDIRRLIILEKLTKYSFLLLDENEFIKNSDLFLNCLESSNINLSHKFIDVFLLEFLNIAFLRLYYPKEEKTLFTTLDICKKKDLLKYLVTKNKTLKQFINSKEKDANILSLFEVNTKFYIYWAILKCQDISIISSFKNKNLYLPYNIEDIIKTSILKLKKDDNETLILSISKTIKDITPLIISVYKKGPYRYLLTLFFRAITNNEALKLISLDINSIKKEEYKEYLRIISDYINELLSENILSNQYSTLNRELKDFVKSKNDIEDIITELFDSISKFKKLNEDLKSNLKEKNLMAKDKKIIDNLLNSYTTLLNNYENSTTTENKIIAQYNFINDIHNLIANDWKYHSFISREIIHLLNNTKDIYLSKVKTLSNDIKLKPIINISSNYTYCNNNTITISLTIEDYKQIKSITLYNLDSSYKDINNTVLYEPLPFKILNEYTNKNHTTLILKVKAPSNQNDFNLLVKYYYFDIFGKRFDKKINKQIILNTQEFKPINNPYIKGKPVINDKLFFGRDNIVYNLTQSLLNDTSNCIIIYGQKRSGKTSIFKHVKKKIESTFVVLDINIATFNSELQVYKAIKSSFEDFLDDCDNDNLKTFEQFEITDYQDFKRYINKASKLTKELDKQILIMIDEFTSVFEYIKNVNYDFDDTFMKRLKELIELDLFKIAVIGQNTMPEFINAYPNEFAVTTPVYINYLEHNDAKDLIKKPIYNNDENRFLENTDRYIAEIFNGQPYYIQMFCSELVDRINNELKQDEITLAFVEYHLSDFIKSKHKDFFDPLVPYKETETFELLTRLSKNSEVFEDIYLKKDSIREDEKIILRKLHDNKVIEYSQNANTIKFIIPFFQMWLKEQ